MYLHRKQFLERLQSSPDASLLEPVADPSPGSQGYSSRRIPKSHSCRKLYHRAAGRQADKVVKDTISAASRFSTTSLLHQGRAWQLASTSRYFIYTTGKACPSLRLLDFLDPSAILPTAAGLAMIRPTAVQGRIFSYNMCILKASNRARQNHDEHIPFGVWFSNADTFVFA